MKQIILELEDLEECLSEKEFRQLQKITDKIAAYRLDAGKGPASCIEINEVWRVGGL